MIRLNLGCGVHLFGGWVNIDKFLDLEQMKKREGAYQNAVVEEGAEFVKADICNLPFPDNHADIAEAHQVLEHLPFRQVGKAVQEVYRVLKPGGKFYADVPSMDGLALDWLDMSIYPDFVVEKYYDVMETIYGNQAGEDSEGETHRTAFNMKFFNYLLVSSGFKNGDIILAKKGSHTRDFGELVKGSDKNVYRYDNLLCEVTK